MDSDRKAERLSANAAFTAALALASGEYVIGECFLGSMVRAHLLAVPVVDGDALEIAFDVDRLHGESGAW